MILLPIEGVLRQPGGLRPDPTGVLLYRALCSHGRVGLLGSEEGQEKDEWFLNTEELVGHASYILYRMDAHPTDHGRRVSQISKARAAGHIELVVEPNPEVVATLHEEGIPTLLYLHPKFTNPEFRPDFKSFASPWDDMVKVIDYQAELKAKMTPRYVHEVSE